MKIRKATDTSDMRGKTTKDRVCEECKKIEVEGVYLTLGYFFGFLCTRCLFKLEELLAIRFDLPHVNTPTPAVFQNLPPVKIAEVKTGIIDPNDFDEAPQLIDNPDFVKVPIFPSGMDSLSSMLDTSGQPTNDVRDILGNKVTQEAYDYLIDRQIALERALQEAADTKIRIATSYLTLKGIFEESAEGLKQLEKRMLDEK